VKIMTNPTAGLPVDRMRTPPVSDWSDRFPGMDMEGLDLKEGAQVLRSTDRGTPAPSHLSKGRFHDHLPPPPQHQATPHARNLSPSLSRNFPIAQQLRTALGLLWTQQERLPTILWLVSTSPPLSRHSITLLHKINRALDSRGGSVQVRAMVA